MLQQQNVSKVLRLPRNLTGRDFVIGDVHGAYDMVIEGMKSVKFDRQHDRLLSVGDLIDRGPLSARCLKFLQQPFTHAIRGNHEQTLLDIYKDGDPGPELMTVYAKMFGIQWWLTTPQDQRLAILEELSKLPVVIEVETLRGTVGLVHGDVPKGMSWPVFVQKVEAGDLKVLDTALNGRERLKSDDQSGVNGIGRVFVGHTVQFGGPKKFGNVYCVDTGAIFSVLNNKPGCGLTMADISFRTNLLAGAVPDDQKNIMTIEAIAGDDLPFGKSSPLVPISPPGPAG